MTTNTKPHDGEILTSKYDDWRYLDGVRTKRILAFAVDYLAVFVLCGIAAVFVALVGLITLGAGWLLYFILVPTVALAYVGWTIGGPKQATLGMQMLNIKMARFDGRPIDFMTAVVHAVLFWAQMTIFAPLLLAPLFLDHKQSLHDLAMGLVAVRSDVRD